MIIANIQSAGIQGDMYMGKYTFLVKEKLNRILILRDISSIAKEKVLHKGKDLDWLKFAVRTKVGYMFLANKEDQYNVLQEISHAVSRLYPDYPIGKIADMVSELVNTTVKDAIDLYNLGIGGNLSLPQKGFLKKQLISVVSSLTYVPRHPWLFPQIQESTTIWKVRDLTTNNTLKVLSETKGDFYNYFLSYKGFSRLAFS